VSTDNPYSAPSDPGYQRPAESSDLTAADWLLCIFCSGIGCIIGIVRLIQGKPNAGKMIGISLLFAFLWNVVRALITLSQQGQ
jgi:hypothetical protein